MTRWLVWGVTLALLSGTRTLQARAAASPSARYNAASSVLVNAAWFLSNFIFVQVAVDLHHDFSLRFALGTFLYYVSCTSTGSVLMHWLGRSRLERLL